MANPPPVQENKIWITFDGGPMDGHRAEFVESVGDSVAMDWGRTIYVREGTMPVRTYTPKGKIKHEPGFRFRPATPDEAESHRAALRDRPIGGLL